MNIFLQNVDVYWKGTLRIALVLLYVFMQSVNVAFFLCICGAYRVERRVCFVSVLCTNCHESQLHYTTHGTIYSETRYSYTIV